MPVVQIMHLFFALFLLWFNFLKIEVEGICGGGGLRVCLQLVVRETFSYQYLMNYVNCRDEIHIYLQGDFPNNIIFCSCSQSKRSLFI